MSSPTPKDVASHWHSDPAGALLERIDAALRASGRDPETIAVDDLLTIDEFHIRGREATEEVAKLAGLTRDMSVLDVGSGLGGPSRFLASRYGCSVTGIDITEEYCATATALAQRTGLASKVDYRQGDALDLPFDDASFDLSWTQHISMNIIDKRRMFEEMLRVTRPGGRIVIYDPIRGDNGDPVTYPVPWSRDGEISFLIDAAETRSILEGAGLAIEIFNDVSLTSLEWFRNNAGGSKPVLGLDILLGPEWPTMAANMVQNIADGRLAVVQVMGHRS